VALAASLAAAAGCGSTDGDERSAGPPTTTTATTTTALLGHHGPSGSDDAERPTIVDFNGPERARLAEQLVAARAVALRYPTVADALAAGYEPTTPYAPGTGAHYGKDADTHAPGQPFDISRPQSYLYDGTEPDSRVVGLMYVQLGGDEPPDGFAGPLDRWQPFPGQCLEQGSTDPVFPTKDSVTRAECDSAGGRFLDITAWIQHVWVVPGWEAPGGVFAHANADLVCADGTTDTDDVAG
jgi:hypothetical protein